MKKLSILFLLVILLAALGLSAYSFTPLPAPVSGRESLQPGSVVGSDPFKGPEQVELQTRPTRTPRPTGTPVTIPPPSDPETTNMMIGFAIIAGLVVALGVWVNRSSRQ